MLKKFLANPNDVFIEDKHKLVYKIFKKAAYLQGFEVVALGFENISKKQMLFIPNHKANCDPLCLFIALYEAGYYNPITFVAKKELSKYKSIRTIMNLMNGIFIDRQNGRSILECYQKETQLIKHDYAVIVFPEATRVPGHDFKKEFKPTTLKVAYENMIPIAPVTIYGSDLKKQKNEGVRHKIYVSLIKPSQPNEYINIKKEISMENFKKAIIDNYFSIKTKVEKL